MLDWSDAELACHIMAQPQSAGDAEGELCRRFAPRIRLYGLRHLRDEQAAADLVQDVLVTVLKTLRVGQVRQPAEIGSFMLGTCRMTVMDQRRGDERHTALMDTFGEGLARVASPPSGATSDLARLRSCLDHLPERDRTVVVMTFYAEDTAAEIARAVQTTEGNVRVIRHRALARLLACVESVPPAELAA